MKLTMSPARAYILGLWKGKRTKEGVGVEGKGALCEIFIKACLEEKLAQTDKIQIKETGENHTKCFFYNSAIRKWLEDEFSKRDERLKYKNDFAASYFAGVFDASGGFVEFAGQKTPYFFGDRIDEIVLMRLGFRVKKEKGKIAVLSPEFYGWISGFRRRE